MLDRGYALADLLVAEDDAALLDFRCEHTGIPLWPLIRLMFFRMMMSDLLYGVPLVSVGSATSGLPVARAASTLARSFVYNVRQLAFARAHAEICILTDSLGVSLVNGKWFNRLSDHFALTRRDRTLVLEEQWGWKWLMPRAVDRVLFHAPYQVNHLIVGKLLVRSTHRDVAGRIIDLASRRAADLLGWRLGADRRGQLVGMFAAKLAGLPNRVRSYSTLLAKISPRVLLVDSGCYGNSAAIITAARSRGVVTAEFQHGAVSAGHDAYNVAPSLRAHSAYRLAIPDYFLAFGEWWAGQINIPVNKVVVGNPHRTAQLRNVSPKPAPRHDVLLLGDGIESDKYIEFARACATALVGTPWRMVFRPHPLERATVAAKFPAPGDTVAVDLNPDIYESLASAGVLISEQSSGLFEAIGLSGRILVWKTPKSSFGFPVHPFATVETPTMLAAALATENVGIVSAEDRGAIWADDWQHRYEAFLASCGVN